DQPLLFHLPGIGGHRLPDITLTRGLLAGGLEAEIYIYDWTGDDEGLNALTNTHRHAQQSGIVAGKLAEVARRQPQRRIILTSHSGGAGIAAWALERLPPDVQVDTWLMIAPAVSPDFDLSRALAHVRGRAYSFNSSLDPVLGFGTRNFGTIDRVKTESAGRNGFVRPPGADEAQYQKLVQFPYDPAWVRLGHPGEHIGATSYTFARRIIAPLLLSGQLPSTAAATGPSER
ncbi:MAG: hypothetical protein NZM00_11555, partial [Anaerolinea sp.]|nr:hypothetical protein [Anaerolinea sp.]